MRRVALLLAIMAGLWAPPLAARETVDASAPSGLAVTLYRDPNRGEYDSMNREWPRGFAMITEKRTVTLPPGESTVRFDGVAEGMIAVSAIVTGLPGGTIEKNRNADLLSPASLIDGTLGNRVTITRTNPATGQARAEDAIIRTRADGGLVLQTANGFEAVRCSGLPERLTFESVPRGLSAQPVFTIDTNDPSGGTYEVELTYLAWGFDWQAHYVATLGEPGHDDTMKMRLVSWLTLLNDNGQSFPDAELLVVAGRLSVVSNFQGLSDPPDARPLQLTCYPFGSTAEGSDIEDFLPEAPYPPPPAPPPPMAPPPPPPPAPIAVTAARAESVQAVEEALGDLKLYRVPVPVTVAAKSLKQVMFLDEDNVEGRLLYRAACSAWDLRDGAIPAAMLLTTVNDEEHGLGVALPMGGITVFEPSAFGDQLVAEVRARDYAEGQDIELALAASSQVLAHCERLGEFDPYRQPTLWTTMRMTVTNANRAPARVRIALGTSGSWQFRGIDTRLKDGAMIVEVTVPGNGRRELTWEIRPAGAS